MSGAHNAKRREREERDTTVHLIKIQILPMLVVLLDLASMIFVHTDSCSRFQRGLYDPSIDGSPPKWKAFG